MLELLLLPSAALAAPPSDREPSLGLRWSDPSGLAPTTEREFDEQLTSRLGRAAFVAGADGPTLSVGWQGTPERCRLELSLEGAEGVQGTRVIESPRGDCRSLVPALLTVSALLVESYESARSVAATPAPEPARADPPPPGPTPPSTTQPETAPSPARWLLSFGGALGSGLAPKLELGPAAAVAWAPLPTLRVGLQGSWLLGQDYGEGPGISLEHRRAALLVCGMPLSARVALGLCGTASFHYFHATGTSLSLPDSQRITSFGFGAEARVEWQLTRRLWWVGHAGADIATRPLYFYYETAGAAQRNVFEQARVNPVVLIALSLEVP